MECVRDNTLNSSGDSRDTSSHFATLKFLCKRFIRAARNEKVRMVRLLLIRGLAYFKSMFPDCLLHKTRPIDFATQKSYKEIVQVFLEREADVNYKSKDGKTQLHVAVKSNNRDVIQLLLEHKSDVNAIDCEGLTPLSTAVLNSYEDITEMLLEWNADVNLKDRNGWTPLHIAVRNKNTKIVSLLLIHQADVNFINEFNETALHIAGRYGCYDITKILLEWNSDVNAKDQNGCIPLHNAVKNRHGDIISLLLEHRSDVNSTNGLYETPLHTAATKADATYAKLLVKHDADVEAKDENNKTSLFIAVKYGCKEVVQELLEQGASVNARDTNGFMPLHFASGYEADPELHWEDPVILRLLLMFGADPNAKSSDGLTPLHYAASSSVALAKILLENFADVNEVCHDGETPLFAAVRRQNTEVLQLLLEYNTDINVENIMGNAAFSFIPNVGNLLGPTGGIHPQYKRDVTVSEKSFQDALSQHIIKRREANLYISDKNKQAFIGCDSIETSEFKTKCEEEVKRMKCRLIDVDITLYDILTGNVNCLRKYVCNENTLKIMEGIPIEKEFPLYATLLCAQFAKCVERKEMLEKIEKFTSDISNHDLK